MSGEYSVIATNTDLVSKGCTEITDTTLNDIQVGTVVKFLWATVDGESWGDMSGDVLGTFTTIDQLEAKVDQNPYTRTATVRDDGYGHIVVGSPASSVDEYRFVFDKDNGVIEGAYFAHPDERAPGRLVVFIESQP